MKNMLLIGLIAIFLFVGCSKDNPTSPPEFTIIGTWYNVGRESHTLTFYENGRFNDSISGSGDYSYIKSEKKGLIEYDEHGNYEFTIEDDELVVHLIVKSHYKKQE